MIKRFGTSYAILRILVVSLFFIVLLMTGFSLSCQSQETASPATSPGSPEEADPSTQPATLQQFEVVIEGFAFKPAEINVLAGSTVTWHNKDSAPHTATARDNSFDSGRLSRDDTFSYTFEQKGTFDYYCVFHPYMEGKVVVE